MLILKWWTTTRRSEFVAALDERRFRGDGAGGGRELPSQPGIQTTKQTGGIRKT
jgi:hypothetical protein